MLREMGGRLADGELASVDAVFRDPKEDPVLRIDAAQLLLTRRDRLTAETKRAIFAMARAYLREGIEKPHLRLCVIQPLIGELEAEQLMLEELRRGADLGQSMHMLGKMRSRRAVPLIAALLDSQKSFYRTRAYLALGEIGTKEAATVLLRWLPKDPSEQNMILMALGATRDPRAKEPLLRHLSPWNPDFFGAALEGLQHLGDPSTLPALERALQEPNLPAFDRKLIERTIAAVKKGGIPPQWP